MLDKDNHVNFKKYLSNAYNREDGGATAQLHDTCHSNVQLLREEEVIALVADICDRNGDNFITVPEFVVGFAQIIGYSLPFSEATILGMNKDALITLASISGLSINRADCVNKWHGRFGDSEAFAHATCDAYDTNKDGRLTVYEIEAIYNQVIAREDNGDGRVSAAEFRAYLGWVYGESC